jgi:hypothetical protein
MKLKIFSHLSLSLEFKIAAKAKKESQLVLLPNLQIPTNIQNIFCSLFVQLECMFCGRFFFEIQNGGENKKNNFFEKY